MGCGSSIQDVAQGGTSFGQKDNLVDRSWPRSDEQLAADAGILAQPNSPRECEAQQNPAPEAADLEGSTGFRCNLLAAQIGADNQVLRCKRPLQLALR